MRKKVVEGYRIAWKQVFTVAMRFMIIPTASKTPTLFGQGSQVSVDEPIVMVESMARGFVESALNGRYTDPS